MRPLPPNSWSLQSFARALAIGGLAVAAAATAAPFVTDVSTAAGPTQESVQGDLLKGGPLDNGQWRTYANGDRINQLHREDDALWAATDGGGLVRWDLSLGFESSPPYVQLLSPQDGLPSNIINAIASDGGDGLWLATDRGLSHYNKVTGEIVTYRPDPEAEDFDEPGDMPALVVTALLVRPDGRLWVGFGQEWDSERINPLPQVSTVGAYRRGGLALFDPAVGTWSHEMHATTRGGNFVNISSENVTDLTIDKQGNFWIGTRQYYQYDRVCHEANLCTEGWVLGGGGLVATNLDRIVNGGGVVEDATFTLYRPSDNEGSSSTGVCFSDNITQIHVDDDGNVWVGTHDRGLLLFQFGLFRDGPTRVSCSGIPFYRPVATGGPVSAQGLRGRHVFDVDSDERGCVWIAHGSGRNDGEGVAVLCHKGTFHDSSASNKPWETDDEWEFLTFDGLADGSTDALITAIDVESDGSLAYMGTRSDRFGDGYGIRRYEAATRKWLPLRTGDNGLPSNQISDVRVNPANGDVWFALQRHGVAMFDGQDWHSWRAFGAGRQVAIIPDAVRNNFGRLPIDIPTKAAYDEIFDQRINYIKIGEDDVRYRVIRYRAESGGLGPFIDIQPNTARSVPPGTPIFLTDRGPASNHASQIAFGRGTDTRVYVGGRESIWLRQRECVRPPECWLDGGLSAFDGERWVVWEQTTPVDALDGTGVVDQEVRTIREDLDGRIWTGTGDPGSSSGDGISVYDPSTDRFTYHYLPLSGGTGLQLGGNGVSDIAVDPATGHVWTSHFPARKINRAPNGSLSEIYFGGGISRWDGTAWSMWRKDRGALLRGFKDGSFESVLVDRGRDVVWLGGWDGDRGFHWLHGVGVHAVLNWCPLDACTNEAWRHRQWTGQGEVRDIELDPDGRLWVGLHRRGLGTIPPKAGLRILDEDVWYAYTPQNSGLSSQEIEAIDRAGDVMWIGTLKAGASWFSFVPPATPTPTLSPTPVPTFTPTPTTVVEPTETPFSTSAVSATPSRTPRSHGGEGPDCYDPRWPGWCEVFVPFTARRAFCNGGECPQLPSDPTPIRIAPTASASSTQSATQTPVPTDVPTTSAPATWTPPHTATNTPTPDPLRTATSTPTATVTWTPQPSPVASSTPTATLGPATNTPSAPPKGEWTDHNRTRSFTRNTLRAVRGVTPQQVLMVGDNSTILIWDGVGMTSGTASGGRTLNAVSMLDSRTGVVAGDRIGQNGTLFTTTTGGQQWRVTNTNLLDDWTGVALMRTAQGTRGLVVGRDRGMRLYFDGATWSAQSPDDRNNASHNYSGLAMTSETNAVAISSSAAGARMYFWNGTGWRPGPVTGALYDIHMRSASVGAAVGATGRIWTIGPGGEWQQMANRPTTAGRDLHAVYMLDDTHMWVAGERGSLWYYDGRTWEAVTITGVNRTIYGLWFSDDGRQGWAVGEDGTMLRFVAP